MKTLKLSKHWPYITPEKTIEYPAGEHEVSNEIHAAAVAAGVTTEEVDGGGAAKAGSQGGTDGAKR